MIAEPSARRRGLAKEALQLLLAYAVQELAVTRFVAKIKMENAASLGLFAEKLGFVETGRDEGFGEVELLLRLPAPAALPAAPQPVPAALAVAAAADEAGIAADGATADQVAAAAAAAAATLVEVGRRTVRSSYGGGAGGHGKASPPAVAEVEPQAEPPDDRSE